MSASFTTPPFRALDEFVGRNGRFEAPDFQDSDRWASKVLGNLIYFQTNYFIILAVFFLPLVIFYTNDFALCLFAAGSVIAACKFSASSQPMLASVTRNHPLLFMIVISAGSYLVLLYLGSIYVFLGGIVFPMSLVFLHASLRTRNIRGRIVGTAEKLGAMRTPMGVFLELFGETFEQLSAFN